MGKNDSDTSHGNTTATAPSTSAPTPHLPRRQTQALSLPVTMLSRTAIRSARAARSAATKTTTVC